MTTITNEEQNELDGMEIEAENVFFSQNDVYLPDYMPEDWIPRYDELYRKAHGHCRTGECGSDECENCKELASITK